MELVDISPAFGLRIECEPVTLRPMRESDAPRVCELVAEGVHEEGARPFLTPWNVSKSQPLESLQFYYRTWAAFSPETWTLLMAVERVRHDFRVVTPETFVRPLYEVVVTGVDAFRRAIGLDGDR